MPGQYVDQPWSSSSRTCAPSSRRSGRTCATPREADVTHAPSTPCELEDLVVRKHTLVDANLVDDAVPEALVIASTADAQRRRHIRDDGDNQRGLLVDLQTVEVEGAAHARLEHGDGVDPRIRQATVARSHRST